jgi:hypothetical protein
MGIIGSGGQIETELASHPFSVALGKGGRNEAPKGELPRIVGQRSINEDGPVNH